MGCEMLTAGTMKVRLTAFWNVTPYILVVYRCFGGTYCLRILFTLDWGHIASKGKKISTKVYITFEKPAIFEVCMVRYLHSLFYIEKICIW
jgi:hypothetical protein